MLNRYTESQEYRSTCLRHLFLDHFEFHHQAHNLVDWHFRHQQHRSKFHCLAHNHQNLGHYCSPRLRNQKRLIQHLHQMRSSYLIPKIRVAYYKKNICNNKTHLG